MNSYRGGYRLQLLLATTNLFAVSSLEIRMEVLLYYAPNACSLVPYITLTEAGANFEARPLNMSKEQQRSADYVKLNPKHKVPLLVVDGRPLSENVAIQIWIARSSRKQSYCRPIPGKNCRRSRYLRGVHLECTRFYRGSTQRLESAICRAPTKACADWPGGCCSRTTKLPMICLPGANISSSISRLRTCISSGVSAVGCSLTSISPYSRIAQHISNA